MKKAQIEILGLMIIMVLIALGVLFAVKYVFLAPKTEIKQEFTEKNIALNMLDVMLGTDVLCNTNHISIQNLLIDCNRYPPNGIIMCGSASSCTFVENEIKSIFASTLDKWGNKYKFKINNAVKLENGECKGDIKTGIQPLPYDLEIKLEICD